MRLLLIVLLLTASSLVAAQPSGDDNAPTIETPAEAKPAPVTAYQQHMRNGVKLFKESQWDGAIAEFEAAYAAEKKASPLINLALAHKKLANPAKAIEVLETALREHRDTMPPDQLEAAQREIDEMRGLLSYVTVKVTPASAKLYVDDRLQQSWASGQVLTLSPGHRTLRAEEHGYASLERYVRIVSGNSNALVELALEPTHGEVIVTAHHRAAAIDVDGNQRGRGLWKDMLRPGPHTVTVRRDGEEHTVQITVAAGGRYTVTQLKDGTLESDATAPLEAPGDDLAPEADILRGAYGTGSAAFLAAFAQVEDFDVSGTDRVGAAVGLHLGYRVADWAGFEVMGQYSDIRVGGKVADQEMTFALRTLRTGALLRVMYPGRSWFRFLGTVGAGAAFEWLEWRNAPANTELYLDERGVGPFGQVDLGVEFELNNVLIDLMVQHSVQGTKHFDLDNGRNAFDTKPIFLFGPSARVGYGLW